MKSGENEKESSVLSAVLAWTPLALLIGIGLYLTFVEDDWYNDPHSSGLNERSFGSATPKPLGRLPHDQAEPTSGESNKSEEETFQDLVAGTPFAGLRLSDFDLIQEINTLNNRWAEHSIPILIQFMDSEVSFEEWHRDTPHQLAELQLIAGRLELVTASLPDSPYKTLIANKNLKLHLRGLDLYSTFHDSVVNGKAEKVERCMVDFGVLADEQERFALMILQEAEQATLLSPEVLRNLGHQANRLIRLLR